MDHPHAVVQQLDDFMDEIEDEHLERAEISRRLLDMRNAWQVTCLAESRLPGHRLSEHHLLEAIHDGPRG